MSEARVPGVLAARARAAAPSGDTALARRLAAFIDVERALRAAKDADALRFVLCNRIGRLVRLDTAVLVEGGRVTAVAGVSGFEADAPLVSFARDVVAAHGGEPAAALDASGLDTHLAAALHTLGLDAALVVALRDGDRPTPSGHLVLVRRGDAFTDPESRIAIEACDAAAHALHALAPRRGRHGSPTRRASRRWLPAAIAAGCIALALLPVRQSVMADGEIVAARPEVVVAGIDGVVRELLVAPNERVVAGQPLLRLDDVALVQERERAVAELELARDRLREARQSALGRDPSGSLLAELEAEIDLKRLDVDFVDERLSRLELKAGSDGVALYSREQDWLGRAVRTGERIMEIAVDGERRVEAWVAVADAIELEPGDAVKFFPDAFPLDALAGTVHSTSFFARRTPEDVLAYRVVGTAAPDAGDPGTGNGKGGTDVARAASPSPGARLGMKGSVRLYGKRAALGYQLLRRPLGAARRFLGV